MISAVLVLAQFACLAAIVVPLQLETSSPAESVTQNAPPAQPGVPGQGGPAMVGRK